MHFNLFNDHLSQVIYSSWVSRALVPKSQALHNKLGENTAGKCMFCVDLPSLNTAIVFAEDVYLPREISNGRCRGTQRTVLVLGYFSK